MTRRRAAAELHVMWPDPKEGCGVEADAFALRRRSLRSRGAAAEAFFFSYRGERRCVVRV
jgi:hypothetical protein